MNAGSGWVLQYKVGRYGPRDPVPCYAGVRLYGSVLTQQYYMLSVRTKSISLFLLPTQFVMPFGRGEGGRNRSSMQAITPAR